MNKEDLIDISNSICKIEKADKDYTNNKKWIRLRNLQIKYYKIYAEQQIDTLSKKARPKNFRDEINKLNEFLKNADNYKER